MTLDEILALDIKGKNVLIIGRPGSGKTWLAKQIDSVGWKTIHTDDYLLLDDTRSIQGLIEDAPISGFSNPCRIIEGVLGYALLLTGAKEKSYMPDIVIECEISAGKQREVYLKERDASKLQFMKRFQLKCMGIMDQYYKLVPESEMPQWITFKNEWNDVTEKQN